MVYFRNLKVVAVGDLFSAIPDPDFDAGGSLMGWGPVLAQILKLDFDILNTEDLSWRLDFTGDRLDGFYAELSRK